MESIASSVDRKVNTSDRERHGHTKRRVLSPTYRSWRSMRNRCFAKSGHHARRYRNRGITICKEWDSFLVFLYDMGERPDGMTLERVNNDKGYDKGNCCWASKRTQTRNTSKTIRVEFSGVEMCLKDAAESAGLSYALVYQRMFRLNWTFEKAMTST